MSSQQQRPRPKVENVDGTTVITLTDGRWRGEENYLARELAGLTDGLGPRHLVLELGNVPYLNSIELGALVTLHKRRNAAGGRLTLAGVNPLIYKALEVTRLRQVLDVRREGAPPAESAPP
jgi:anti-anti-sigma factor